MSEYRDFTKHLRERDDDSRWEIPLQLRLEGFDKHKYRYGRSLLRKRLDDSDLVLAHRTDGIDGDYYSSHWLLGRYGGSGAAYVQIIPRYGAYGLRGNEISKAAGVLSELDLIGQRTFSSLSEAERALKAQKGVSKLARFEDEAGMSPEWFCQYVERRRKEMGALKDQSCEVIAAELANPARRVRLLEIDIIDTYRELAGFLDAARPNWRKMTAEEPAIPPNPPSREIVERLEKEMEERNRQIEHEKAERERLKNERIAKVQRLKDELEEFGQKAKMSGMFFCQHVERRREDGATFADIAKELNDPGREISFDAASLESTFEEIKKKLNHSNRHWRNWTANPPEIAPKDPEHPVGIPYIKLKSWTPSSSSGLASRIADHVASRAGGILPSAGPDEGNDPGPTPWRR